MAIRQKEIHDKLTPRGSLQNSAVDAPVKLQILSNFLTPHYSTTKNIKRSLSNDAKEITAAPPNIDNYAEIFNTKIGSYHQIVEPYMSP